MNAEEYRRMFRLEGAYWWFASRRRLILGLIERNFPNCRDLSILDIGCGTGATSRDMRRFGAVVSTDFVKDALLFARTRECAPLCQADAHHLPFREGAFDLVVAMDIIEHLKDDRQALAECFRACRPGGKAILTVPAHMFLWSEHDVALHHYRRYNRNEFQARLQEAGWRINFFSFTLMLCYPPIWLYRRIQRLLPPPSAPKATLIDLPRPVNRALIALLNLENALIHRGLRLPFGISLVCIAERPGEGE
ncbi:MAG: class I SAM-dependent methyltransferase [Armatimonadetes bacterium]|nr:class I SAM-dependent methyltransferase [Armatimonadota bacterium]